MKLKNIAHSRTGDKGNISNISLIAYNYEDYLYIKEKVTPQVVKNYFNEICKGNVERYEVESVWGLNFVLYNCLGGGVTKSLSLDKHGKTLGMILLDMDI